MSMEPPPAPKEVQNPGRIGLTPTQSLPPPKEGQVCQLLMLPVTQQVSINVLVPQALTVPMSPIHCPAVASRCICIEQCFATVLQGLLEQHQKSILQQDKPGVEASMRGARERVHSHLSRTSAPMLRSDQPWQARAAPSAPTTPLTSPVHPDSSGTLHLPTYFCKPLSWQTVYLALMPCMDCDSPGFSIPLARIQSAVS